MEEKKSNNDGEDILTEGALIVEAAEEDPDPILKGHRPLNVIREEKGSREKIEHPQKTEMDVTNGIGLLESWIAEKDHWKGTRLTLCDNVSKTYVGLY